MKPRRRKPVPFWGAFLSPKRLLLDAAAITVIFLVGHLCGLREHTSVLCGTVPVGTSAEIGVALAVLYAVFYFAAVLLVPVLVLAAGVAFGLHAIWPGKPGGPPPQT
jgi:hypothetical protein